MCGDSYGNGKVGGGSVRTKAFYLNCDGDALATQIVVNSNYLQNTSITYPGLINLSSGIHWVQHK